MCSIDNAPSHQIMANLEALASEFQTAYSVDPVGVYLTIRDELRSLASDRMSFSIKAVEFYKEMDKDQQEVFIVENIVPLLAVAGWPMPHTRALNELLWNFSRNTFTGA